MASQDLKALRNLIEHAYLIVCSDEVGIADHVWSLAELLV
jgi:hypothetical protein